MQQIVSITDARNNLSELVKRVSNQDVEIVIVRDSEPEAVLVPYCKILEEGKLKEKLFRLQFNRLLKEGRKAGKRWAKKNNIDLDKLSEEELYEIIDQVGKGTFKSRPRH
jgi:prevent-host-death family protein